jgi:hypothetical protein
MKHRMGIASLTHLGGSMPDVLTNSGKLTPVIKKMLEEATELYFKELGGCDYKITDDGIELGIEPAYQFEDLKIIKISKTKANSFIQTGRAFDVWGSGVRSTRKYYGEYNYNCKFTKFVDKWHNKIVYEEKI